MNKYLANALREPAEDWVPLMFYEDFCTSQQWIDHINEYYPPDDGIEKILNQETKWSVKDFQALYIACWMYKPVVKGSYMLKLPEESEGNVRKAYKKKLDSRWTSHLHGPVTKGANASKNWRFLKGYHELLVQYEEAPTATICSSSAKGTLQ